MQKEKRHKCFYGIVIIVLLFVTINTLEARRKRRRSKKESFNTLVFTEDDPIYVQGQFQLALGGTTGTYNYYNEDFVTRSLLANYSGIPSGIPVYYGYYGSSSGEANQVYGGGGVQLEIGWRWWHWWRGRKRGRKRSKWRIRHGLTIGVVGEHSQFTLKEPSVFEAWKTISLLKSYNLSQSTNSITPVVLHYLLWEDYNAERKLSETKAGVTWGWNFHLMDGYKYDPYIGWYRTAGRNGVRAGVEINLTKENYFVVGLHSSTVFVFSNKFGYTGSGGGLDFAYGTRF